MTRDGSVFQSRQMRLTPPVLRLQTDRDASTSGRGSSNRCRQHDVGGLPDVNRHTQVTLLVLHARTCEQNSNAGPSKRNPQSKAHAWVSHISSPMFSAPSSPSSSSSSSASAGTTSGAALLRLRAGAKCWTSASTMSFLEPVGRSIALLPFFCVQSLIYNLSRFTGLGRAVHRCARLRCWLYSKVATKMLPVIRSLRSLRPAAFIPKLKVCATDQQKTHEIHTHPGVPILRAFVWLGVKASPSHMT